jgi:ribosome-binding factor A
VKSAPRITRVNELLKREIADLIEKHIEHRKDCLISVIEVNTTPDLRQAKVHISILGDNDAKKTMMLLLKKKRSFIQQLVARNITLKYTPVIEFYYDSRIESGDRVLAMINQLENEK